MRDVLQGIALAVLTVLLVECHWLRLPRPLYFYLSCQILFSGMCLLMQLQRVPSRFYERGFYFSMLLLAVGIVVLMAHFCRSMHSTLFTAITLWSMSSPTIWIASLAFKQLRAAKMLHFVSACHVLTSTLFLWAALVGIACWLFPVSLMHDASLAAVSLFLGLWGLDGLGKAGLYLRAKPLAARSLEPASTIALILIFGSLAFFLSTPFLAGNQSELSRQPVAEVTNAD